jgi:type I restriction enzyme S subunit
MIDRLKPYPAYKDSGVPWLGQVPEHWEVRRLRNLCRTPIKNGVGESGQPFREDWPRYIRITDIAGPRQLKESGKASLPPQFTELAPVLDGDLLLAAVGATYGKSYLYRGVSQPACFAGYLVRWSPSADVMPEWASYWTESSAYWDQIHSGVIKATIENFSAARYKAISVAVPPLAEQTAIVRFLDYMDRRIRRVIHARQRQIKLLEEYWQALIHEAVTGQIDVRTGKPYPAYKESGVPWLGQVPEHWEIRRLGSLLRERRETNEELRVTDVLSVLRERGVIPYSEKGNIGNKKSDDISRYKVVRPNDIVVNSMNVIIGSVGISTFTGCISPVYYILTRREAQDDPRYLNAYFQTKPFQQSLIRLGNGILAHRMRIPMELLKCEPFPRPPAEEQTAIVEYLDAQTAKIDGAIAVIRREIELVREYRERLIADVVTGKVDVREEAARLPEEPPEEDSEWMGTEEMADEETAEEESGAEVLSEEGDP